MSKFTKKAIVDTFFSILNEKPLSKITVTEMGSQHFFGQFAKPLLKGARFPSASAIVWG
jgi:hypothetical protein